MMAASFKVLHRAKLATGAAAASFASLFMVAPDRSWATKSPIRALRGVGAAVTPQLSLCCGISSDDITGGKRWFSRATAEPATIIDPTQQQMAPVSDAPLRKWDKVQRPILVGIAGPSGSGKSSVAEGIKQRLKSAGVKCEIVSADSYYLSPPPGVNPKDHNFDEPAALELGLLAKHLGELKSGRSIEVPQYDFSTHCRLDNTTELDPPDVVLVDGIFTFCVVELRDCFDLRIYVDADSDVCLARRMRRDIVERGRDVTSVLEQYERFVKPARNRFIAPSANEADLILPHGKMSRVAIDLLTHELQRAALGWNRDMVDLDDVEDPDDDC